MSEMSEPTTAAGRALIAAWKRSTDGHVLAPGTPTIVAIEAEAVAAYRADLAAKVRANAHLICNCEQANCPRLAAFLALIEGEPR